ncbi:unnamed protein product [Schistocephalus solidus]|uniref:Reverse transcriptase domain-containing protein n=1 Tax=Schistocephalus solidus TaxID=70667 RepID=A0A183TRG1_SCHSO|nr:unnamed protein product [Schistocephalus solidus]
MENIIKKAVMHYLEQYYLLSDPQHVFRSGMSCLTNSLFLLQRWTKARAECKTVHAICIDFKKAFENVPHRCLRHKLRSVGVTGNLPRRIQNFWTGWS